MGAEERVLEFRNATREQAQPRSYLDWRYETAAEAPAPQICWLRDRGGAAAGMAAIIFRPYWFQQRRCWLPVIGDIGLRAELRGRGLGRQLLQSLTNYLREECGDRPALVIPTAVAHDTLAAVGWRDAGALVPHVFAASTEEALRGALRNDLLARAAAGAYERAMRLVLRDRSFEPGTMVDGVEFDASFDALAQRQPRVGVIQRDFGTDALRWRYARHPHYRFEVTRLVRGGELAGFIVHSREHNDCAILDMSVLEPQLLKPFLGAFLLRAIEEWRVRAVRMMLSDSHPHRPLLRRLLFIPRRAAAVFQVLPPAAGSPAGAIWPITAGDKDV